MVLENVENKYLRATGVNGVAIEIIGAKDTEDGTYNSGLFCVSMTAATGMPKFDTGPQKSKSKYSSVSVRK